MIPLTPNLGLIEWVKNTTTLKALLPKIFRRDFATAARADVDDVLGKAQKKYFNDLNALGKGMLTGGKQPAEHYIAANMKKPQVKGSFHIHILLVIWNQLGNCSRSW